MSQDDIRFDEVKYREPERRTRPDRDRRWACLAYETPGPIDLPIFLDRLTADTIERHALRDTSVELGGILLGKECIDEQTGLPFVLVTRSLEAKHYENTQASFTYTHDSWEEITRERDRQHPELDIVGWYHTHPDFGIFLSSHDLFIHRNFFDQPLQVAYVVDPVRQTRGFFQWRDGGLDQVGGFFITADRADRILLSRLVNDLESIPNTEGGGSLSPRLEAELIAMLSRPHVSQVSSPLNLNIVATLFTMIGLLAGVCVVMAGAWLYSLGLAVKDQGDQLKDLNKITRETADVHRVALDTLLSEAADGKPDRFIARYQSLAREREQAVKELERQKFVNDKLSALEKGYEDGIATLKKDVEKYKKEAARFEQDAGKADDLRRENALLVKEKEKLEARSNQLDQLLETSAGKSAAEFLQKFNMTWWAAVIGWGATVLLALGLIANIGGARPGSAPEAGPASGPSAPEPPHQIT